MNEVIRRNHYDVTNSVSLADPRIVCKEVCAILDRIYPGCDPRPVIEAFDVFGRLYAGTMQGYLGCDTWFHDAQHSLDCALVMARLLEGHERRAEDARRLGQRRAQLGVIAALFHDAGYIRKTTDEECHGAQFTLFHVRRSGDFLFEFLPSAGLGQEAPLARQLVHYTGFEIPLDQIDVRQPLDRVLGFILGSADVLAQMSDRCYLEKCRDFLYAEFEICGLAGTPAGNGVGSMPLFTSREELLRKTPEFIDRIWKERMDGYFQGVYRYAASESGEHNIYLGAIAGHLQRLHEVLQSQDIHKGLRRRAEFVDAGALRFILGFPLDGYTGKPASARPFGGRQRMHAGAADPRNYIPT